MILHRLCRAAYARSALDGEGARLYGGRWNPKGVPMVYTASSLALAALESFVHFSSSILPLDYVHVALDVPDDVRIEAWSAASLPRSWATTPPPAALAERGREWVLSARTALLRVPSAVILEDSNVLVNPAHPDTRRIRVMPPRAFRFDPRLVKKP